MQLVIGYGSQVRGDDGLGQMIAQAVAARRPDVNTITHVQLMPEYAEPISAADRVFFIDAGIEGEPGTISCQLVTPATDDWAKADSAFAHSLTPTTLLGAARALYGRAPAAYLITVVGASFGYTAELSPELSRQLPTLVKTVLGWIEEPDLTTSPLATLSCHPLSLGEWTSSTPQSVFPPSPHGEGVASDGSWG